MFAPRQKEPQRRELITQRPGFRSCKTLAPILYVQRWHRDILIQLTLDAAVRRITAGPGSASSGILDLIVEMDTGVVRLLGVRDELELPAAFEDQVDICLRRSAVIQEPRMSNARIIWSMRKKIVPPADRLRILMRLQNAPSDGVAISALISCVNTSSIEPVDAVLSLACDGLLVLDIDSPLVPETMVRICPRSEKVDESNRSRSRDPACSPHD